MLSLDPRSLEIFRAVAETGSATSAAALLNSTQPSVTRAIAELERRCGFALFERGRFRMRLMPEGQILLDTVRRSFEGLKSVQAAVESIRNGAQGSLSGCCLPFLGEGELMGLIGGFLRSNRLVRLKLAATSSERMFDAIATDQIDFGLVVGAAPDTLNYETMRIGQCALMLAVPRTHRLAKAARVRFGELSGETMVQLLPPHNIRAAVDAMMLNTGTRPALVHETTTQRAAARLIAGGDCIGFIDSDVAAGLDRRAVVAIPVEPAIVWDINLVYRRGRKQAKTFANFLKWLKAQPPAKPGTGARKRAAG